MKLPRLILASVSPRRSDLLKQLGVTFEVVPAQTTEIAPAHFAPGEIAQTNAIRKARAVAALYPDALVIGADTVVALGTEVFGKPRDMRDAHRMLKRLSGRVHHVITGVTLMRIADGRRVVFADTTRVTFRKLTSDRIAQYTAKVDTLDKAGAYAIQERGDMIVESMEGSFSNVVGLPLERLREELQRWPKR